MALTKIQRNIRRWMAMRNWQWWKLYTRVKPLLTQAKAEDEMRKMAEEYETTKAELEKTQKRMKEVEEQNEMLQRKNDDMTAQMSVGDDALSTLTATSKLRLKRFISLLNSTYSERITKLRTCVYVCVSAL